MRVRDYAAAVAVALVVVAAGLGVADASVAHAAHAAVVHHPPVHACHAALVRWFNAAHGDRGRAYRRFVAVHCGPMSRRAARRLARWVAWWLGRATS